MIRLLLAFLMLPLLVSAAPAPRDWTKTVTRTADGAYRIGNPAAKVKLVEYLSYTCSHCAHYAEQSAPILRDKFIRSGSTSVELRHATRDKLDLAATIVARCGGPAGFVGASEQVFAKQDDWYPQGLRFEQTNAQRMALYPQGAQLRALAYGAGLADIGKARGLSDAALATCFDDDAALLRIAAMSDKSWKAIAAASAPQPGGTPTFVVNGKPYATLDWAGLEKILRAAGAK
ncbi:thioredoxin domain-containing protein [Sphingomonas sp. PB4P5]|uniref:thioredoxin domain-containing protein n=1 Tax=Parasphingomonas puruogangriensis TaxID=3096155 RepID=UPI002FC742DA